jgi:predicted hydrocarbon binding protein
MLAQLTGSIMGRLDKLIVDPASRKNLLLGCTCPFPQDRIDFLRSKYHEFGKDIAKLIQFMIHDDPRFYEKPILSGNTIQVRKKPRNPEYYAKATTVLEKRKAYCFCPLVWATEEAISETFCYCSSGWYKNLWEGILEKKVEVEVVGSVIQGDEFCDFIIHLPKKQSQMRTITDRFIS